MTSSLQILSRSFPFQLTSSQGGWRECNASKCPLCFSTHILTRRMTGVGGEKETAQKFSTHILTRRMTSYPIISISIAIFQLTSSQGGWPRTESICSIRKFFNSHPHKEDDQKKMQFKNGSWLFNSHPHKEDDPVGSMRYPLILFSTHILTRRMTVVVLDVGCRWTFQLTSSQGGWRQKSLYSPFTHLFNSHPHKEDDKKVMNNAVSGILFNSHPHKEDDYIASASDAFVDFSTHILTRRMTLGSCHFAGTSPFFNSHPHKEDDI